MPADFEKCARNGGRIRTVSGPSKSHGLGSGEYVKYCYLNGESYRGEIKKKEKQEKSEGDHPRQNSNPRAGLLDSVLKKHGG